MEEAFELRLQLMALKGKQSSGITGGKPRATGSRGESGRPIGGAVQGSAASVSGRVSFLSGTKLDCGRLSVESARAEEIPQHPSLPARLVSPEQSYANLQNKKVRGYKAELSL